jgi:outer membrane protein
MKTNKSGRSLLLGALFTMLLVPQAFAAGALPIDLQTAIDKAFATHPDIKIAEYNLESARGTYNAARESYGPAVTLSHETGRYGQDASVSVGGITRYARAVGNSYSNTAKVSVPIYTAGELEGTVAKAKANYEAYVLGEHKSYMDLKKTTTDAYYTLLECVNTVNVAQESVTTLADHLKNVKAQFDVGVVAKVDVLRSEVELSNARQTLIKAQNAYDLSESNLDNIMGIPQSTKLAPKETLQYAPYNSNMDYCINYALANRPDLRQSALAVKAAQGSLDIAKSGYRPQVAASASNVWENGSWPGTDNSNWTAGIGVSINAFDSGVTKSKVSAAKAALLAQEETHRQNLDSATLDVRQCYLNLRESEKRISTTQTAVAQAEEDYRIAQVRYQAGVGTNTDVLDAQVALTTARNNFNQALYDYNMNKNALQTSMGIGAKPLLAAPVVNKTTGAPADEKQAAKYKQQQKVLKELKAAEKDADKVNRDTQVRLYNRNQYQTLTAAKAEADREAAAAKQLAAEKKAAKEKAAAEKAAAKKLAAEKKAAARETAATNSK